MAIIHNNVFVGTQSETIFDNTKINVGDSIRSLYINKSTGINALNTALTNVVYDETETIPDAGITVYGLHTFLSAQVRWSNHIWSDFVILRGADLSMMGSSFGISGCAGYFLSYSNSLGATQPVYVSEMNSANEQLFSLMQIPVTNAGFYVDYIDVPAAAFSAEYAYNSAYRAEAVILTKDDESTINSQNFVDVFFSKFPSTFNGQFVTKDYVDNAQPAAVQYLTTAPTADNPSGLKFVVLSAEPATYYNGYSYTITEA